MRRTGDILFTSFEHLRPLSSYEVEHLITIETDLFRFSSQDTVMVIKMHSEPVKVCIMHQSTLVSKPHSIIYLPCNLNLQHLPRAMNYSFTSSLGQRIKNTTNKRQTRKKQKWIVQHTSLWHTMHIYIIYTYGKSFRHTRVPGKKHMSSTFHISWIAQCFLCNTYIDFLEDMTYMVVFGCLTWAVDLKPTIR